MDVETQVLDEGQSEFWHSMDWVQPSEGRARVFGRFCCDRFFRVWFGWLRYLADFVVTGSSAKVFGGFCCNTIFSRAERGPGYLADLVVTGSSAFASLS